MKICPKCNLEYDDEFMFCHHCGSKLQIRNKQRYCSYCGQSIDNDSDFCGFCGKSLKKVVAFEQDVKKKAIAKKYSVGDVSSANYKKVNDNNQEISYGWWDILILIIGVLLTKGMVKGHAPFYYYIVVLLILGCLLIVGHKLGEWIKDKK